ncbi:MAG TPA: hypothetical protein VIN71_01950 [Pseudomonadales bacterium]
MVIQDGKREEKNGDLTLTATGQSREIIEIRRDGEQFYLASCAEPLQQRAITIDGNRLRTGMNGYRLDVSLNAEQNRMTGNASQTSENLNYTASVAMQKIASGQRSVGSFDFFSLAGDSTLQNADCFQETVTRVVGRQFIFSQWADLRGVIVTDRLADDAFRQLALVDTVAGNAEPVDFIRFAEQQPGIEASAQTWPQAGLAIRIGNIVSDSRRYQADIAVQDVFAGSVRIAL